MTGGIAPPGPHRTGRRPTDQARERHGQHTGHPGRQVVGGVIGSGGSPTESGITRRPVADHRVQRVDPAVGQDPRNPGYRHPHQRRNLRIRGVLRHRFAGRAGQPRAVENRGVATAQRRQQFPGTVEVPRLESVSHRRSGPRQRRPAQRRPGCRGRQHSGRRPAPGPALQQRPGAGQRSHQNRGVQHSRGPAIAVAEPLKSRCTPTESRHRMTTSRVGEQRVGNETRRDPGGSPPVSQPHPGSFSHMIYCRERVRRKRSNARSNSQGRNHHHHGSEPAPG